MGACAVFIDAGYAEKVFSQEHNGQMIDYGKLARLMCRSEELLRAYYYNCLPYQSNPPTEDEKAWHDKKNKFFEALEHLERFEVRLGRLIKVGVDASGKALFQQKRVDLMLGVDMALLAAKGKIHTVALFTGDSDYVPAVEAVKREGVSIVLWHGALKGGQSPSRDLFKICDERCDVAAIVPKALRAEKQEKSKLRARVAR